MKGGRELATYMYVGEEIELMHKRGNQCVEISRIENCRGGREGEGGREKVGEGERRENTYAAPTRSLPLIASKLSSLMK